MNLVINRNLKIVMHIQTEPVKKAICNLKRDITMTCNETMKEGIELRIIEKPLERECFQIKAVNGNLELYAGDDLGFIYGMNEISRTILGIEDFWFWNDQKIISQEEYQICDTYQYYSKPVQIKFRGWFVNDEVLIHTWSVDRQKDKPWEMVFEALLRCGGNMVIPGTDKNSVVYREMATSMGLYITHHHAEPLGGEMFARAYPSLNPSYDEHAEKFQELWKKGIEKQKHMKVIWNLGFRGQGDCPFWVNDPRYNTQESRGELMSKLIKIQYDMVKKMIPDANTCTNLYGETMELYRDGYLKLPKDVIKIWADNGYGKMVTRRQENHNPRICSLPPKENSESHGAYYHVSFYDLQAANHITMLPNAPQFVKNELYQLLEHGVKDFWIINCSNVKPHTYFLDFIAKVWRDGMVDVREHREKYLSSYYGTENLLQVSKGLEDYPKYALAYGKYEDEHAGEQFSNHIARILISQFMRNRNDRTEELLWATDGKTLEEQVQWYGALCKKAHLGYKEYLNECEEIATTISDNGRRLFCDSILLHAQIHYHCFTGAHHTCECLIKEFRGDHLSAFYSAGLARKEYLKANAVMRECEHGKWHNFYQNECLTDMKQSAMVLGGLMSYIRNIDDGPHFYQWQREFLYSEEDKRVMLIMNMENHLADQEIFELMEEKWNK